MHSSDEISKGTCIYLCCTYVPYSFIEHKYLLYDPYPISRRWMFMQIFVNTNSKFYPLNVRIKIFHVFIIYSFTLRAFITYPHIEISHAIKKLFSLFSTSPPEYPQNLFKSFASTPPIFLTAKTTRFLHENPCQRNTTLEQKIVG